MTVAATAAPLRLLPPAPATERRHEGRSLPSPRLRSRAQGCPLVAPEPWRRLRRVQGPVTALGLGLRHGRSPRPLAASRCRGRILVAARRHSQGSGEWVPGWSLAKEKRWRRRQRPARPLRPNAGIGSRFRAGLEGTERGPYASVADPDGLFLLLLLVPSFPCVASRPSPPPPLRAAAPPPHAAAARPSAAPAVRGGNGPRRRPPPLRKAGGDGGRAAERGKEGPPLLRPTPRLLIRPLPQPSCPRCPCPFAPALLVPAAPRQLEPG